MSSTPSFRAAAACCCVAVCLATATTHAAHWPQFRGPTSQGHSTETKIPLEWSASSNVLWKATIPGEGWSSPVIWKDHVFLTTATDGGQSCRVLALHAKTGAIRWNHEVFQQVPRRKEGRNSYATPTPATDGKLVYTCFGDGSFAALTFDGKVAWTNRAYPFYSQHGLGTSPLLADGLLVMPWDASSDGADKLVGWQKPWDKSFVLALDAKTGREAWKTPRGMSRIAHGAPVLWTHKGRKQVVTEAGDVVQGFDLKTGHRLWTSKVLGEGKVPSPVIAEDLVFASGGWGGRESIKAFRMGAEGDLDESNLVWEQKKGVPKLSSLLHVKPYLFAMTDGGIATCYNATTGEIIWQERVGGNFSASPILADGKIVLLNEEGKATTIAPEREFKLLGEGKFESGFMASPAVDGNDLVLRTKTALYRVGSR